jgi:uncharacterized protein (TIGR02145 family)
MKFTKNLIQLFFALCPLLNLGAQTVNDADGNVYTTVTIGNQVWLGENLRTTKFSNNDPIAMVLDSAQWPVQIAAAYCYYNNDSSFVNPYGNLYNWYTVDDARNVCPTGYHVPNATEWDELVNYLGGVALAGGKLKEQGFTHWQSPNTDADNLSNFTALPSGWRANNNGVYENIGYMCYLWASSAVTATDADIVLIGFDSPACYASNAHKLTGLPVRCIQNSSATGIYKAEDSEITISPNPTNDNLILEIPEELLGTDYHIIDLSTKKVITGIVDNTRTRIDLSQLPKGIYCLVVGKNTKRFIKS